MILLFALLPIDIIAKCFADYLDVDDVSALDIACCSTLDRPAFLDAIHWRHAVFKGITFQSSSDSYFIWLISRNVSVLELAFDKSSFSFKTFELLIDKRIFSHTINLTIDGYSFTEDILLLISDLFPSLQKLHLESISSQTSSAALTSILQTTNTTLTDLIIRSCSDGLLDSSFSRALTKCIKLQRLELSSLSYDLNTPSGQLNFITIIESCSGLPLQYLNIRLNDDLVNNQVIKNIAHNLHSLITLDMSHNSFGDNGVVLLQRVLPYLESLSLDKCDISGTSWTHMTQRCKNLSHLSLLKCDGLLSSTFLSTPTNSFPSLTSLNLTGISSLTDSAVIHLSNCFKSLKRFEIGGRGSLISDKGVKGVVRKCSDRLELLSIERCELVTDMSILTIATCCPNLETLYCDNCSIFDFSSFELLGEGCTLLKQLSIGGQEWIDSHSIDKLTTFFPRLEKLVIDTEANDDLLTNGSSIIQVGKKKGIKIFIFLSAQAGYTVFVE